MQKAILWGVSLSPFFLKTRACLHYKQVAFRHLPVEANLFENIAFMQKLKSAKTQGLVRRYPAFDPLLDEYPSVPYFSEDGVNLQYDSSAIAQWLDRSRPASRLFPEQEALGFIAHFIDEAFDEFGLYLVHHMRWVTAAKTQIMGQLLASEFKTALPPGGPALLARLFPKRQVRRCPYLFSVAPKGYSAGVSRALTPPSREGFPETHTLLNQSWKKYVRGLDEVLRQQPYLLGDRFTIADASAYGQLAMNLVDRQAADALLALAPTTFNWLKQIEHGKHVQSAVSSPNRLYLSPALDNLLNTLMGTFAALMVQNEHAYIRARQHGETQFNEAPFNQGRALYHGHLTGYPFRSVVKTFQVRVWREIKAHWQQLSTQAKTEVRGLSEFTELFE